jgi:putative addiction module CopG family antidote
MPTSVALTPRLEAFVRKQVEGGGYNNVSEVIREGLRLLERRQLEDAARLNALRRAVAVGTAAMDEGDFTVAAPQDVAAVIAGLGDTAVQRATHRRSKTRGGRDGGR